MYKPQELRRKARINTFGVDDEAQTSLYLGGLPQTETETKNQATFGGTLSHIANDVVYGAMKSLEGVVDAGIMLGGLFGADVDERVAYDFSADVDERVAYDFSADLLGRDLEGEGQFENAWGRIAQASSSIKDDGIVSQVAEAVGGMLPTIAVGLIGKGAAAAAGLAKMASGVGKATKIAQGATVVIGAMGKSSEGALLSGADYESALHYGMLSGVVEGTTELVGGKLFGEAASLNTTPVGKLLIKTGGDKYARTFVGKLAYAGVSEGVEEMLSEFIDPVSRRVTGVSDDLKWDFKDIASSFVVGGLTGGFLDSVQVGIKSLQNADVGGFNYLQMVESLQ